MTAFSVPAQRVDADKPLELGDLVWCQARVIEEHGGLYFEPVSQAEWVHQSVIESITDALTAKDAEIARLTDALREREQRGVTEAQAEKVGAAIEEAWNGGHPDLIDLSPIVLTPSERIALGFTARASKQPTSLSKVDPAKQALSQARDRIASLMQAEANDDVRTGLWRAKMEVMRGVVLKEVAPALASDQPADAAERSGE